MVDRVLQTQMCLLLDAYYEAKYNEKQYWFRKGRNHLQVVGLVRSIINKINKIDQNRLGVALLEIKDCFAAMPLDVMLKCFKVPTQ